MKKFYLFFCAAMLTLIVNAKNGYVIFSTPIVQVEYQVTAMSPNGRWACGNINDGNYRGFIWDLISGELTELSASGDISVALDVSNDGVVVGSFTTTDGTPNNAPVETIGKWENGKWSELSLITEDGIKVKQDGYANAISADGKTIAGIGAVGKNYFPLVWQEGKLQIVEELTGAVYDVSSNGEILCGWTNHPSKNNRTCAIWMRGEDGKYAEKIHTDITSLYSAGPFVVARGISPNGKYVSAFRRIYNIEERTSNLLKIEDDQEFEAYGITNDAFVYGYVGDGYGSRDAVMVNKEGTVIKIREYLAGKGVDLKSYPNLISVIAISADLNTFAMMAYDEQMVPRSVVVKLGVETEQPVPVALKAHVLEGINAVSLKWSAPLTNQSAVKGYNVYRNGVKINDDVLTELSFIDENITTETASYTIRALYELGESADCESVSVTIVNNVLPTPRNFFAVQSGLNHARLVWDAPFSGNPLLNYCDDDTQLIGLGGGDFSFEGAVRLRTNELEVYRKNGYTISEVSFAPMSRQAGWAICLYYEGDTEPFYEQEIPVESLSFGEVNRVALTTPQEIPEDVDIIVAIRVNVDGFGGYSILGVTPKRPEAGYSDLIRQEGQEEFISMYNSGLASQSGSYEFNMSWTIGATLSNAQSASLALHEYVVYADGVEVARTNDTNYFIENLKDGSYKYEIAAVYANQALSEKVSSTCQILRNESVFHKIVPQITTSGAKMTATWDVPSDKDERFVTYANNTNIGGMVGAEADQYSYMAAVKFGKEKLYQLKGYQITAFKFYPLSDADFSFILQKDNEELVYLPLERESGYKKGMWNTVTLDEPVPLDPNSTYYLILDCYDVTPETAPLGMDNQIAFPERSDLYSTDDGETFLSLSAQGGKNANWMLGMIAEAVDTQVLPVDGYNIYLNNKLHNQSLCDECQYVIDGLADGIYNLRVNPVYGEGVGEVLSDPTEFTIDLSSGIHQLDSLTFQIKRGEDYIRVIGGDVQRISLYDLRGSLLAQSLDEQINIANLPASVYLLKVKVGGKEITCKIQIL